MGDRQLERVFDPFTTNPVPATGRTGKLCLEFNPNYLEILLGLFTRLEQERLWWKFPGDDSAIDHVREVTSWLTTIKPCDEVGGSDIEIFSDNCVLYKRENGVTTVLLDARECSDPLVIYDGDGPQSPPELLDGPEFPWYGEVTPQDTSGLPDENLCAAVQSTVEFVLEESESIANQVNAGLNALTGFLDQNGITGMFNDYLEVTWAQAFQILSDFGFSLLSSQLTDPVFEDEFKCALFCRVKNSGSFDPDVDIPAALSETDTLYFAASTWIQFLINPYIVELANWLYPGGLLSESKVMRFWNLGVDDESNDCGSCACSPITGTFSESIFVAASPSTGSRVGVVTLTENGSLVQSVFGGEYQQANLEADGTTETECYVSLRLAYPMRLDSIRLETTDGGADGDNMSFFNDVVFVASDGTEEKIDWNYDTAISSVNRTVGRNFTPSNNMILYRGLRIRLRATGISPSVNPLGNTVLRLQLIRVTAIDAVPGIEG